MAACLQKRVGSVTNIRTAGTNLMHIAYECVMGRLRSHRNIRNVKEFDTSS